MTHRTDTQRTIALAIDCAVEAIELAEFEGETADDEIDMGLQQTFDVEIPGGDLSLFAETYTATVRRLLEAR